MAVPNMGNTGTVQFEYIGRSSLTAIGPVTGKRYRFEASGARVAVDVRDSHSLASIRYLRRMRG